MTVGANQRVGHRNSALFIFTQEHAFGQELQIHLMHDPDVRRHDAKVVERLLSPAQKLVSFTVSLEFTIDVKLQCVFAAEAVDLHRMVDHEVDWDQRIDLLRIAAKSLHRASHRGQIDDSRHTSKILQHNA